jgi:3-dehydroquinate synthetase/shikimate kinase
MSAGGAVGEHDVIVLTGMMGVGKSHVARALASRLGWRAIDLDAEIEAAAGRDIPALIAAEGEGAFRARERAAVAALDARADLRHAVVATGGWTVGDPTSRATLASWGPLVCLRATPATIAARLGPADDVTRTRPSLAGPGGLRARIAALLDTRWPIYGLTPWQVATDGRTVEEVAALVEELLAGVTGIRALAVAVSGQGANYSMLVGEGLLDRLGLLQRAAGLDGRTVLLSDRNVGALYGERAGNALTAAGLDGTFEAERASDDDQRNKYRAEHRDALRDDASAARGVEGGTGDGAWNDTASGAGDETGNGAEQEGTTGSRVLDDPAAFLAAAGIVRRRTRSGPAVLEMGLGEPAKSPATVVALWQALAAARLDRRAVVIGLGGGVVTDTAGFVAAGLLRGIRWTAAPTTLLGMVDASLGGKTGVNLAAGKNLAGAFWQPALVVADPSTLATLRPEVLREGLAEVVKAAVIGDVALLEALEAKGAPALGAWDGPDGWSALVARAAAVKAEIVRQDAREAEGGRRVLLNLGHTFAHAIERVSDYHIRHGAAVAIGLVAAARLAEAWGVAEEPLSARLSALLRQLGLPVCVPDAEWAPHAGEGMPAPVDDGQAAAVQPDGRAETIGGAPIHGLQLEAQALRAAMGLDKKRAGGRLRFVLPVAPGDVRVFDDVPGSLVLDVLRTMAGQG